MAVNEILDPSLYHKPLTMREFSEQIFSVARLRYGRWRESHWAALLVCAVSPRLPLCRVAIPGAAFIASIAYSAYLIQKLVIHAVGQFCTMELTGAAT